MEAGECPIGAVAHDVPVMEAEEEKTGKNSTEVWLPLGSKTDLLQTRG